MEYSFQITDTIIAKSQTASSALGFCWRDWIFTIMDESTGSRQLLGKLFEFLIFSNGVSFANIVVERVGVIFFICDISRDTNFQYPNDRSDQSNFLMVLNKLRVMIIIFVRPTFTKAFS